MDDRINGTTVYERVSQRINDPFGNSVCQRKLFKIQWIHFCDLHIPYGDGAEILQFNSEHGAA